MNAVQSSWYGSSKDVEWYTEAAVIRRVVAVLGAIDLDPCSNPPPYNVPATLHMSRTDGGLNQRWAGRCYVNAPYSALGPWMAKLAHEIAAGRVTEAITLTPARTGTRWFQVLWDADALCFVMDRVYTTAGHRPPFSSVIGYFGKHPQRFAEVFADAGKIVFP